MAEVPDAVVAAHLRADPGADRPTACAAGAGGERSAPPARIDLRIAFEGPDTYSEAKNR
jgi:hypothetical protein